MYTSALAVALPTSTRRPGVSVTRRNFLGNNPYPLAARIAQVWLIAGTLGVLAIPALRGSDEWLGAWPLWLVLVPLANLAILRHRAWLPALHRTVAQYWVAAFTGGKPGRFKTGG